MGHSMGAFWSSEAEQLVWEAEDGRCEGCGRAVELRCAEFARVDETRRDFSADNLHLLCPDCLARRPDLLDQLSVTSDVAQGVARLLHLPVQSAGNWLVRNLQPFGVLVDASRAWRWYRLPGVALFEVVPQWGGGASVVAIQAPAAAPTLEPSLAPQARSRGLPVPDRHPRNRAERRGQLSVRLPGDDGEGGSSRGGDRCEDGGGIG